MMELYIYFVIFVFGTVMGSFLNVVAIRLSHEESILWPGSHCDNCNHKLKWYENIPIISYLIQGGKSRCCNTKIPISSLLIEIVTGVLYCTAYHSFGFSYDFVISLIFISSLIAIIVADIEYMIIPDEVIGVSGILIIVCELIFFGIEKTGKGVIAGILAFILMYVIKLIGDKLFKKESMGGGDIKLMFLFGLVIGAETINTSIEATVDLACPKKDPLAKIAKDTASGAVLVFALTAAISGLIIFIPKIIETIKAL